MLWLLDKFWRIDIIGKIYILMILFVVVVTIATYVVRFEKAITLQDGIGIPETIIQTK